MTKIKMSTANIIATFEEYRRDYGYEETATALLIVAEILVEISEHLEGVENKFWE